MLYKWRELSQRRPRPRHIVHHHDGSIQTGRIVTTILLTVRIVIRMLRRRWTPLVTMGTALVAMRTMSIVTMMMGGLIMMGVVSIVPAPASGAPWPPIASFPWVTHVAVGNVGSDERVGTRTSGSAGAVQAAVGVVAAAVLLTRRKYWKQNN